jgi:hypothetical protein
MNTAIAPTLEEAKRFWRKIRIVGNDDCWPWCANTLKNGYGQVKLRAGPRLAHRVAYTLAHGIIPEGLLVCHHCDIRNCCNPTHMFVGTHFDNSRDAASKGKTLKGENHPFVKNPALVRRGNKHHWRLHPEKIPRGERCGSAYLTADDVLSIRYEYAGRAITMKALAAKYNTTKNNVQHIVRRTSWRHI